MGRPPVFVEQYRGPERYPQWTFRDHAWRGRRRHDAWDLRTSARLVITAPLDASQMSLDLHFKDGFFGTGNGANASPQAGQHTCAGLKSCISGTTAEADAHCGHGPCCQAVAPEGEDATARTQPHHQDLPIFRSWCRRGAGSSRGSSPPTMPLLPSRPLRARPTARVAPASNSPSTWLDIRPASSAPRSAGSLAWRRCRSLSPDQRWG